MGHIIDFQQPHFQHSLHDGRLLELPCSNENSFWSRKVANRLLYRYADFLVLTHEFRCSMGLLKVQNS